MKTNRRAVINKTEVLLYETVDGAYNDSRFISFILPLLRRLDEAKVTDLCIVMDKCVSGVYATFCETMDILSPLFYYKPR